jgi:hypothetical protein
MTCWKFKTKIKQALEEIDTLSDKEKLAIEKILSNR